MSSSTESWPEATLAGWDAALAADDERYRRAYPGPPGPGPVHTVYVPVPRFDADTVGVWQRTALQSIKNHTTQWDGLLTSLVSEQRLRPDRASVTIAPSSAAGPWRSCSPNRSRTCGSTSRTGSGRIVAPPRTMPTRTDRHVGPRSPSPSWPPRRVSCPRAGGCGSGRWRRTPVTAACGRCGCSSMRLLDENDRAANRFRRHAAESDVPANRSWSSWRCSPRSRTISGWRPACCNSRSRWRHRRPSSGADGRVAVAEMVHAAHGRGQRTAFRHLRLHGEPGHSRRLPEPATSGRGLREVADAVGGGGDRRAGQRRVRQQGPGRLRRDGRAAVAHPCRRRSARPAIRDLPGVGPAPRAAAEPVRRDLRASSAPGTPRRRSGWGTTTGSRQAVGSSTSRQPHLRWPGISRRRCTAVQSPRPRLDAAGSISPGIVSRYLVRGAPPGVRVDDAAEQPDQRPPDNVSRIGPRGGRR